MEQKKLLSVIFSKAMKVSVGIIIGFGLFIGLFNIVKLGIYGEYYSVKSDLCKNPGLSDGFVPQGIAAVESEEGDVILVSGYMADKSSSRVYITTTEDESYYVTLNRGGKSYTGHAGGIAVAGDTVYISNASKLFHFPLESLLCAGDGESVNIGEGTEINNKASFLYSDGEYLYVGSFTDETTEDVAEHIFDSAEGKHYAICSVYRAGELDAPVKVYSIRDYVQGVCFFDGKIVLSTSHGLTSSVYYFYNESEARDSGATLDGAPVYILENAVRTLSGPAMAEGLDAYDGRLITLTESASDKYLFGKLFDAYYIVSLDVLD